MTSYCYVILSTIYIQIYSMNNDYDYVIISYIKYWSSIWGCNLDGLFYTILIGKKKNKDAFVQIIYAVDSIG